MVQNERDKQDEEGFGDQVAEMQQCSVPLVNEELVEKRLEILFTYNEPDGTEQLVWGKGEVIGVQKNNNVHIQWDKEYLNEEDAHVTCERLLKTQYNKNIRGAWYVCAFVIK